MLKIKPNAMVKEVIEKVKVRNTSYTIKAMNQVCVNRRCVIATITGECQNLHCQFRHDLATPNSNANKVAQIIDEGAAALK